MGNLNVRQLDGPVERARYFHRLLTDIEALEQMLSAGLIERGVTCIGAEQEFCLVGPDWEPSRGACDLLKVLEDPHFTSEITRYNLEINLDPIKMEGDCFSRMHRQLTRLLDHVEEAAGERGDKVVLTGILPTIATRHLGEDFMAPQKRYLTLNAAVRKARASDLEVHIKGVDEVNLHHTSIMYEGCNTSFQGHLQIDPEDFADSYNWAQAIAGPVLSICANAPLLMGRELWAETRIALFTQSVDTRRSSFLLNERESRVGFGSGWVRGTPADYFKSNVARFRSLLSTDFGPEGSLEELDEGKIPKLAALNLHNGTVYTWNRLCYGQNGDTAHLRIENRYLPSGPTAIDEIANLAFWTGIMTGRPKHWDGIHDKMDFRDTKQNFFIAARYGMAAQFQWDGKTVPADELLLEVFLPIAYRGLSRMRVSDTDAEKYLKVIENRIRSQTGAQWNVRTYRELRRDLRPPDALRVLTSILHSRSRKGYPVAAWRRPTRSEIAAGVRREKVCDLMSTRIISAQEDDSAALVVNLMKWNNIHHLPVLGEGGGLIGLITWTDVAGLADDPLLYDTRIRDLMQTEVITTGPGSSLSNAREIMVSETINCLPVVDGGNLVGMLTTRDLDVPD